MWKACFLTVSAGLFVSGCNGNSDSTMEIDSFNLSSAVTTGRDETSTEFWECTFDNAATVEVETGTNTITFWENGRGITGGGSLYTWSITDEDRLEAAFENGERTFVFEQFAFDMNNNTFSAIDTSTRSIGTPDEIILTLNTTCTRMGI